MRRSMTVLIAGLMIAGVAAAPASARGASVDRIDDFGTVVAVAPFDGPPIGALMRADCDFLVRVERPNGSATETMHCTLSDAPVMVEAFQGVPPERTFHDAGAECIWASDYWYQKAPEDPPVYAESFRVRVTPSGRVNATAVYPVVPLDCPDE